MEIHQSVLSEEEDNIHVSSDTFQLKLHPVIGVCPPHFISSTHSVILQACGQFSIGILSLCVCLRAHVCVKRVITNACAL